MKISFREQVDLYGALSGLEVNLKKFLASADEPAGPMDKVIEATSKIADQVKAGAKVTSGEVGQMMALMPPVSAAFDNVYKLFQTARESGYEVAKLVGSPTKGAPRAKKPPTDYSGIPDADIAQGIAELAPKFKTALGNVKGLGTKLAEQTAAVLNSMDGEKSDGVEASRALVPSFIEFRDSVSSYYSILNSMARRVNQLLTNIGHSKLDEPAKGAEPVTETLIVIPWGDEFSDYDDGMLEGNMEESKKTKVEAKKKNGKDEIPEGAVGNLPAPSGAPPVGVENKITLPPMMQVERLVRSLKEQIIEGLK